MGKTSGAVAAGVDPSAPIVTNSRGGTQSELKTRLELVPFNALIAEGVVLAEGAQKHEAWNWLKIDEEDHINHALVHLYAYLSGDRSENHLAHAACRVHFASELHERSLENEKELVERINTSPYLTPDEDLSRLGVCDNAPLTYEHVHFARRCTNWRPV